MSCLVESTERQGAYERRGDKYAKEDGAEIDITAFDSGCDSNGIGFSVLGCILWKWRVTVLLGQW